MAVEHFKRIADATSLPLIAFQYPLATGQGYPRDTLLQMIEAVPSIRAIKDWAGNVAQHEMHIRTLQSRKRPVNVLTTHSAWLLSSLVLGCNGLLSGSGSVIADLQAALFRAVQRDDLADFQQGFELTPGMIRRRGRLRRRDGRIRHTGRIAPRKNPLNRRPLRAHIRRFPRRATARTGWEPSGLRSING